MIWYIPTRFCFLSRVVNLASGILALFLFVSDHDSSHVFMLNAIGRQQKFGWLSEYFLNVFKATSTA